RRARQPVPRSERGCGSAVPVRTLEPSPAARRRARPLLPPGRAPWTSASAAARGAGHAPRVGPSGKDRRGDRRLASHLRAGGGADGVVARLCHWDPAARSTLTLSDPLLAQPSVAQEGAPTTRGARSAGNRSADAVATP